MERKRFNRCVIAQAIIFILVNLSVGVALALVMVKNDDLAARLKHLENKTAVPMKRKSADLFMTYPAAHLSLFL